MIVLQELEIAPLKETLKLTVQLADQTIKETEKSVTKFMLGSTYDNLFNRLFFITCYGNVNGSP